MASPVIGRLAVAGLLSLACAACAPAFDRQATPSGTAHGVAVEGKLSTEAGVREEKGLWRAGTGTHG
ncbi:hypothetical protein [Amycolatopsis sp. cmx-4-61]|uniref:hypothetical protein n=1 Tax=Amycolatopsis sp. cmx-4-61 TaxID=2790937 RepID=UPI003978B250